MSNENLSELPAIEVKAHEPTPVADSGFQLGEVHTWHSGSRIKCQVIVLDFKDFVGLKIRYLKLAILLIPFLFDMDIDGNYITFWVTYDIKSRGGGNSGTPPLPEAPYLYAE